MLDNALIALIITTIQGQLITAGLPNNLIIKQAFQATQQGVPKVPTAFLYKIGDHRFGYPQRSDVWNSGSMTMVHQETQAYQTTFQMSALSIQNPLTPTQYTASDILNAIAYILQSSVTVDTLEAQDVGIMRIMDIRNPYFLDDTQNFEASPSFDFVLRHNQIITSTSPIIQSTELDILTV
jgi:hypothetical protein